jgi:DNA-binding NarL/FixJ family response regulator
MKKIRILLAEDHRVMREGLKRLINEQSRMEVVGEADDGVAACQKAHELHPDIVLMDISMPGLSGAEATSKITASSPECKVIALTAHKATGYLSELFRAGASGYVIKQAASDELIEAIETVAAGGRYIDLASQKLFVNSQAGNLVSRGESPGKELSQREIQVLALIANGYTNKEIANKLAISVKTVETHKANAMRKVDLTSRAEVVDYARLREWMM